MGNLCARAGLAALSCGVRTSGPLLTAHLPGHQIVINGHTLSLQLSVVAAVPADPEPRPSGAPREARTNDLDDRRSLILPVCPLAAVSICPETAITVTECDFVRATAAADPPNRSGCCGSTSPATARLPNRGVLWQRLQCGALCLLGETPGSRVLSTGRLERHFCRLPPTPRSAMLTLAAPSSQDRIGASTGGQGGLGVIPGEGASAGGSAATVPGEKQIAFALRVSLSSEGARDAVYALLQELADRVDEGAATYAEIMIKARINATAVDDIVLASMWPSS